MATTFRFHLGTCLPFDDVLTLCLHLGTCSPFDDAPTLRFHLNTCLPLGDAPTLRFHLGTCLPLDDTSTLRFNLSTCLPSGDAPLHLVSTLAPAVFQMRHLHCVLLMAFVTWGSTVLAGNGPGLALHCPL